MDRLDREARNAMAVLLERGHTKSDVARFWVSVRAPFAITTGRMQEGAVRRPLASAGGGCGLCRDDCALAGAINLAVCTRGWPASTGMGKPPLGAALLEADVWDFGRL